MHWSSSTFPTFSSTGSGIPVIARRTILDMRNAARSWRENCFPNCRGKVSKTQRSSRPRLGIPYWSMVGVSLDLDCLRFGCTDSSIDAHARKIHYTCDLYFALSWGLITGFNSPFPWFYPAFFSVMIAHRALRDIQRCQDKYGEAWEEYTRRVPHLFIPVSKAFPLSSDGP